MGETAAASQVQLALRRVASRLRLVDLLLHGAPAVGVLLAGCAMSVAGHHVGWIGRGATTGACAGLVIAVAVYLAVRVRPVSPERAAAMADHALGLSDRLASAHAFSLHPAPTALMLAAVDDAAHVAPGVDAARVAPLSPPRLAWGVPLGVALLVAACFVRAPRKGVEVRPVAERPRFVVEPDALSAERRAVQKLGIESRGKDAELEQLAHQLDELLAVVDQEKLTRAEVFEQLSKLEAQHGKPSEQAQKPSVALQPATEALSKSKQTRELAAALKADDLAAARAELEKLAAAAEQNTAAPTDEEKQAREEMARALDRASKALDEASKKAQAERDQKMDELEEEERRLQKQHDEHPDDEENERRLRKTRRELERLEREKQADAEQRRQLQRLQKDLQQAAEQLRQKMSPEAMRRAAEELGKMEDEIRKLGSSSQAQMRIAQIKEVLRRAGRVERGPGGQGEGKGQGTPGKDGRGEKLSSFDERAGKKGDTLLLGGSGDTQLLLPLPGQGEPQGGAGDQPGQGDKGPGDKGPGDGIGDQHDPNLQGDATRLAAARKTIHAKGQAGAGPSRSQTILGASDKGFSSRDYHKVYDDYSAAVEEVMSQEGVPPGYRYYVKRYFQLIRPRE